jgi:hypothetical protein
MPEEDLETHELKENIDDSLEKAERAPRWIRYLSLSTAVIAVFAAVASLESGSNSNEAILEKSEAMLNQSRASDQWAYFQSKGVKSALAASQAVMVADRPDLVATLKADADRYKHEADEIQAKAKELEKKVEENNQASEDLMEHHHRFAIAVTLLQIAIALSAIAALTRKTPLWFLGLGVSAAGIVMFVRGFM